MSSIPNLNMNFSPARGVNFLRADTDVRSKYLEKLLAERQKLVPFMHLLPICIRLINQEIIRVSGMIWEQGNGDTDMNVEGKGYGGRNGNDLYNPLSEYWCGGPSSFVVKKALCLEIPVERYPNFNFIGRLLGPRGNSLKRVEASSGCRVFIRGKGSIKDSDKEELLRGKSGYEHLLDPLHILIEAEFPANIVHVRLGQAREIIEELLKPVDESQDMYKKQQLRELAMLNNSLKESIPQTKGIINLHPLNSSGMKRAKTAG